MRTESKQKLILLGEQARFDVSGYPRKLTTHKRVERYSFIYRGVGEGGRCTRLFKVLQTNKCERNCYYCANRRDRDSTRLSFSPKELAELFMEYYTNELVQGFFLSSAICKDADSSQEDIIETARILRKKHQYKGYVHMKILPDASDDLISEAAKYGDRLSVNLEAPGQDWLSRLSPNKNYGHLIAKLRRVSDIAKERNLKAGVSTQLMVGGADEPDRSIINLASKLYNELRLWRVYYSAFIPVKNTPFENKTSCSPDREYRLYQADSLMRKYGFRPEEMPYDSKGFLPADTDLKLAWAERHPELFPIEVNDAPLRQLIRIPGIGRISAQKIISVRETGKITTMETLKKMGLIVARARNFIIINGHAPHKTPPPKEAVQKQLFIWDEM
jgi:putative DNA modification/repair radical SAM protein